MTLWLALSMLLLVLIQPEREFALALYRRWQGADTGHRWIKVTALCIHEALWWLWAVSPLLPGWPWTWTVPGTSPAALAALIGLPVYVAAICVWFVYRHNNGGPQGTLGPARYGWAGYGYPWFYPIRNYIGEWKLLGWPIVKPTYWTEVAELFLGAVTGRLTALALAGVHVAAMLMV